MGKSSRRLLWIIVMLVIFSITSTACGDFENYDDYEGNDYFGDDDLDKAGSSEGSGGIVRAEGSYEVADCPIVDIEDADVTLECGYLYVPERPEDPDSQEIELAVAILRLDGADPDPIVYLSGGPGGSAIDELDDDPDSWITVVLNTNRDMIFIDQRGTGYSWPTLDCPELPDYEDEIEGAEACHDRLEDFVDLTAYNSARIVADLDALRVALGYDQWNVFGISYGTRLALTYMRDYPAGIRSVVIDSVYPPEVDAAYDEAPGIMAALRAMFAGCRADAGCNAAYPDLENVLVETVQNLNDNPALIEIEDYESGEINQQDLYGDDFLNTIVQMMYDSQINVALPRLIYEVYEGDYTNYQLLAADFGYQRRGYQSEDVSDSEGMNYSVQCNEEYAFSDYDTAEDGLSTVPGPLQNALFGGTTSYFDICPLWGAGQAAPVENQPVVSDVPTLVLAGEYDPVTPPHWAALAAQSLSHAFSYVFPAAGHAVFDDNLCAMRVLSGFINDPVNGPDASCINSLPGPDFILPDEPLGLFDD